MTLEDLNKVKFTKISHLNFEDHYQTRYESVDEIKGAKLNIYYIVKHKFGEPYGKTLTRFKWNGKEFKSQNKLLEAINLL